LRAAPDFLTFTVIVRGVRRFALLVAILTLAFVLCLYRTAQRARHPCQLPYVLPYSRPRRALRNQSWDEGRHRVLYGVAPVHHPNFA
jgi:hypothetical protein